MPDDALGRMLEGRPERASWSYRSFAALVLTHGRVFTPAPLPTDVACRAPGNCFQTATEPADQHGLVYVEGLVLTGGDPFAFDHAWAATAGGLVVDGSLPDGGTLAYLGLPLAPAFRRERQAHRGTYAVVTADTTGLDVHGMLEDEHLLAAGLPDGALVNVGDALPDALRARPHDTRR